MQLFAADDFSRRHFHIFFFLGALKVNSFSVQPNRLVCEHRLVSNSEDVAQIYRQCDKRHYDIHVGHGMGNSVFVVSDQVARSSKS